MTRKKKEPRYLQLVKPKPFGSVPEPDPKAESCSSGPMLIEPRDFQSMRLTVTLLASRPSGAEPLQGAGGSQIFGSAPRSRAPGSKARVVSQIALSELLEDGAVLDVPPPDFYQEGQVVFVLLKLLRPGEESERAFSANARIEGVAADEDGALSVRLRFLNADIGQWNEFQAAFNDRQREITEFLAAVRGC